MQLNKVMPHHFLFENWLAEGLAIIDDIKDEIIGYCESKKLQVKPRAEGYAVILGTGEWFHISKERAALWGIPPERKVGNESA